MNFRPAPLPPLIGCGPSTIEAHYEKMRAGDPAALAAARRLADREKSGQATSAERSALWGLRALHDEPDEPSDADTQRCLALLRSAQKGTIPMYGVNPIPVNPFNPGAMNPMASPMAAFSGAPHGGYLAHLRQQRQRAPFPNPPPTITVKGFNVGTTPMYAYAPPGQYAASATVPQHFSPNTHRFPDQPTFISGESAFGARGGGGGGGGHGGGGGGMHGGGRGGFARGFRGGVGGGGWPWGGWGWGGYGYGCRYVPTPYGAQIACPPAYGYGYATAIPTAIPTYGYAY